MFRLREIERTLRLPPSLLSLPLSEAIRGELESLFLDKVVAPLGFCVSIYDIQSIDGGCISPGDGASTYTVKFRLMMFSLLVGEVIGAATLLKTTTDGLRLSLGFFDDIYVPRALLPNPCVSIPDLVNNDQVHWIWTYGGVDYFIDGLSEIKFKVVSVSYPSPSLEQEKDSRRFARMIVKGSLDEDGLGPVTWWD